MGLGKQNGGIRPSYFKSIVLVFVLLIIVPCVAAVLGSHGDTNPPPPPRIHGLEGHIAREEILRRLDAVESMMKEQMKSNEQMLKNNEQMRKVLQGQDKVIQGQDKSLDQCMQRIQEMRSYLRKAQYDYEHPRHDGSSRYGQEAARQAQTMDEGTGTTYQLRFRGSLKARIYTNKPLLDQSDEGIEIAIYRDGHVITSGDLSSVRVEIVALDSDHSCKGFWTEEDFHRQIQMRRGGQGSVLEGDRSVKLVNGKASLGKVWFSEGSSGTRSREFVLAARIDMSEKIEGLRVEEAFMQPPITVLVERSEANEKSGLPMLNDKIHRLKEIAKGGVYSKRLEQVGIFTVEDFLKALNKDEDKLRQILKMKSDKSWKVLVGHARTCDLRDEHELKVKAYMVEGKSVSLFFNRIHDNVGADFDGRYIAKDKFDPRQKALVDRLKKQAYIELDGIDFQYLMIDNSPEKISAGSSSIPMSGASRWNTPDHHAHAISHGVPENSIPGGDAIPPDAATTDVGWETFLASDPLDRPIHTPYGPDSDFFTSGGQFQDFRSPEEPISGPDASFWTAPFGGGGGGN